MPCAIHDGEETGNECMVQLMKFVRMKRTFPRSKLKNIVKGHQRNIRLSKNADILIFLDYMLFLKRLSAEADMKAQESKEKTLQAYHITSVLKDVLKKCKG